MQFSSEEEHQEAAVHPWKRRFLTELRKCQPLLILSPSCSHDHPTESKVFYNDRETNWACAVKKMCSAYMTHFKYYNFETDVSSYVKLLTLFNRSKELQNLIMLCNHFPHFISEYITEVYTKTVDRQYITSKIA